MPVTADEFQSRLANLGPSPGMGRIFALAKELMDMTPVEIERLLERPDHASRVGAVSVMDWQARSKRTTDDRRRELYDLYLRRHDLIDTWDLVDRSAIWVVGEYLVDRPREVLDRLAVSDRPMERRTAIRIAETLVRDPDDLVQKAVGWMLREVGKKDADAHAAFLDRHAGTMPRVMLRYAIEKLPADRRQHYLGLR